MNEGVFLPADELKNLGISRTLASADIIPLTAAVEFQSDGPVVARRDTEEATVHEENEGDLEPVIDQVTMQMDDSDVQVHQENEGDDMLPSSEIEGDEEVDLIQDQVSEHLGRRQLGRNQPVSYVEDDVEWHPSFGRRRITDDDDELWQEDSSSEEEAYFVELMEMFLTASWRVMRMLLCLHKKQRLCRHF